MGSILIENPYRHQLRLSSNIGYPVTGDIKTGSLELPVGIGLDYYFKTPYDYNKIRYWTGAEIFSYIILPNSDVNFGYRHITDNSYMTIPSFGIKLGIGRKTGYFMPFAQISNQMLWYYPDKYDLFTGKPMEPSYSYNLMPTLGVKTLGKLSFDLSVDYPFMTSGENFKPEYLESVIKEEEGKLVIETPIYVKFGASYPIKQFGRESLYQKLVSESLKNTDEDIELNNKRNSIFIYEDVTFDEDQDGVRNEFDECPVTPRGAAVDYAGCLLDSDNDNIPDYYDYCPNTPKNRTVDKNGCPDSDLDGIPDFKDQCNNTPLNSVIDKYGCSVVARDTVYKRYINKYLPLKTYVFNFKRKSTSLRIESERLLFDLLVELKKQNTSEWIVKVHSGILGTQEQKLNGSKKLINSFLNKLFEKGVAKKKFIDLINVLDAEPLNNSGTDFGEQENIRIEVQKIRN